MPNSDDYEFTNANIRKLDFTLANERVGKFWLGQGSMATDGIQEIDLSGTDVIAYSSVADSASGQIIRFSGPGLSFEDSLSDLTIGDAFTNYDGPRRVRVRYDTPSYANFTFAAAYGRNLLADDEDEREQNIFDASLVYANEYETFEVEAGLGYYWQEDDITTWGGSASALHKATGLNLTAGFGTGSPEDGPDGQWWYTEARPAAQLRLVGRHRAVGRLLQGRRLRGVRRRDQLRPASPGASPSSRTSTGRTPSCG